MATKGRPPIVLTQEMLDSIEDMAAKGLKQKHIYANLNISHNKWNKLKNNHPEIKAALKKGLAGGIFFASSKLYKLIKKGNLLAIKFYLINKAGWKEKTTPVLKSEVKSSAPVSRIETVDAIEASRIYQEIMAGSQKK